MRAVSLGRTFMVEKLLEAGADPSIKDKKGWDSFYRASFYEQEDIYDILEKFQDTNKYWLQNLMFIII